MDSPMWRDREGATCVTIWSTYIKKAILKEGSPSCGVNYIYDGNFNGTKIPGMGITAKILKEASIEVISEKDLGGNINGYIWFF